MFSIDQRALVIGGGLAGMTAALSIARQGYDVYLVEREAELGGNLRHIHIGANASGWTAAIAEAHRGCGERRAAHPGLYTGASWSSWAATPGNTAAPCAWRMALAWSWSMALWLWRPAARA